MHKSNLKLYLALPWFALAAGGCSSTEILAPGEEANIGETITLTLTSPPDGYTRAGNDHVLRFTAKLFDGYLDGINNASYLERREVIASSGQATLTFAVPEGEYSLIILADYIPSSSLPDSNGHYPDCYYDTSSQNESVVMNAVPANSANGTTFFNNDNYDFFSCYLKIAKGREEVEKDVELTRPVSKIVFVSSTDAPETIESIDVTKFWAYGHFSAIKGYASSWDSPATKKENGITPSAPSRNELLFYYTFANRNGAENIVGSDTGFKVKFTDGSEYNVSIPGSTITFKPNYITTVKGPFLQAAPPDLGDIILHLSASGDWNSPSQEVTVE